VTNGSVDDVLKSWTSKCENQERGGDVEVAPFASLSANHYKTKVT
jgi:hypothetical protein